MPRRRPLRYTLILASVAVSAVLAAAGGWRYARASAPLSGPIIVISIDTVRADHLPAYGYRKLKTPAIDLLASNGVVFERAYAHVPDTLASHVALLSGRLPFQNGVRGAPDDRVRPGERLLAEMLRDRGYATGGIVSTSTLGRETGVARGFEFFDDEMPESELEDSGAITERDGLESEAIAERWLGSLGSSRAFLFLHLNEPHAPHAALESFAQYGAYDGEIARADEIVGALIRYLKSHQLYDRSTIVLLSDHGEGLGDHGEHEHGLLAYEESLHIPLIVKQEGNEGAGRRVHDLVQHADLVPTILDLVKAPVPATLPGRSLKALLDGSATLGARLVYSEAAYAHLRFGWTEIQSITDGRYRYVRSGVEELYDVQHDPLERDNLLAADAHRTDADMAARTALAAALDRIGPGRGGSAAASIDMPVDPKDRLEVVETYRTALAAVSRREWPRAIDLLQQVLRSDPTLAEAWSVLGGTATLMGRFDLARGAYDRLTELRPMDPAGYLGTADVLFRERKFEEARTQTAAALEHAESNAQARAAAHALLARIALARRDADQARLEATLAHQADPLKPIPEFVEGRVLFDQANYEEALPHFEAAIAASRKAGAPVENLHLFAGDTLQRLERPDEAEAELLAELVLFPHNLRASAALVTLYQAMARHDEAQQAVARQLKTTPTPESYAQAARLLKTLGLPKQAGAVRIEAQRLFTRPAVSH